MSEHGSNIQIPGGIPRVPSWALGATKGVRHCLCVSVCVSWCQCVLLAACVWVRLLVREGGREGGRERERD